MGNDENGNEKNPRSTRMDTEGGPQADEVGEQQLSKIGQQLKQ